LHADLQELDGFPRSRWILSAGIQAESIIQHFHSPDISAMEQHLCILWDFSFASWTPNLFGQSMHLFHLKTPISQRDKFDKPAPPGSGVPCIRLAFNHSSVNLWHSI